MRRVLISCFMRLQRSSIPSNRQNQPRAKGLLLIALLEMSRLLARRQYLASVAVNNLWRDEAVHDKKTAGDFVLISPMSVSRVCRLIHGAFCDQLWAGNDAGDDPGLSRTVGSGGRRRTWLTLSTRPMFCIAVFFPAIREFLSKTYCRGGKFSAKREIKCCNS